MRQGLRAIRFRAGCGMRTAYSNFKVAHYRKRGDQMSDAACNATRPTRVQKRIERIGTNKLASPTSAPVRLLVTSVALTTRCRVNDSHMPCHASPHSPQIQ